MYNFMNNLSKNILATLAYFDVFDRPIDAVEVCRSLVNFKHLNFVDEAAYRGLEEVKRELAKMVSDGRVCVDGSNYYLFGRGYNIALKKKREKNAEAKFKKINKAIKIMGAIPYIEGIFASGSLAIKNTDELSDLDVLVIVRHGRMWLARTMMILITNLMGMRRKGSDRIAPDKICLNHYIGDDSLKIPFMSIYNAQTYSNLVPLYVRRNTLVEDFKKANAWVLDFVYQWNIDIPKKLRNRWMNRLKDLSERIFNTRLGDMLELWARSFQYRRIESNPLTKQPGGRVVFGDQQLEFHPNSIERTIISKYNSNLINLGMPELAKEKDSGLNV